MTRLTATAKRAGRAAAAIGAIALTLVRLMWHWAVIKVFGRAFARIIVELDQRDVVAAVALSIQNPESQVGQLIREQVRASLEGAARRAVCEYLETSRGEDAFSDALADALDDVDIEKMVRVEIDDRMDEEFNDVEDKIDSEIDDKIEDHMNDLDDDELMDRVAQYVGRRVLQRVQSSAIDALSNGNVQ